jgi:LmbE family N-acetylglucosaminyl deacetylase
VAGEVRTVAITTQHAPHRPPAAGLDAQRRVAGLGTVLGVWAHPDDEAYLAGGLLALAAVNGQATACVTATAGEHGTDDPVRWPPGRLRGRRLIELHRSLGALGVGGRRWLQVEDGTCDAVDDAEGAALVGRVVQALGPDTIVTFGPDGVTGHPDHRAVGRWATLAGREWGVPVLHAAKASSWVIAFAGVNEDLAAFAPGTPVAVADHDLALDLAVDGEALDRKVQALVAHRTQTAGPLHRLGRAS